MLARVGLVVSLVVLSACGREAALQSGAPSTSATQPAPPDVLQIMCTADGGTRFPDGTTVAAQADGVHLKVDNRSGEGVTLNGLRLDVSGGQTQAVSTVAPGEHRVACWPGSRHEGPEPPTTLISIEDPQQAWVDDTCRRGPSQATQGDYAADARGRAGDPVELARRGGIPHIDLDGADFLRGGYPEAASPIVVARRDGKVLARFSFGPGASKGRWLLHATEVCR